MIELTDGDRKELMHLAKGMKMIPKLIEGLDLQTEIFLGDGDRHAEQAPFDQLKKGFFSDFFNSAVWNEDMKMYDLDKDKFNDANCQPHVKAFMKMLETQKKTSWWDILCYFRWIKSTLDSETFLKWYPIVENFDDTEGRQKEFDRIKNELKTEFGITDEDERNAEKIFFVWMFCNSWLVN